MVVMPVEILYLGIGLTSTKTVMLIKSAAESRGIRGINKETRSLQCGRYSEESHERLIRIES